MLPCEKILLRGSASTAGRYHENQKNSRSATSSTVTLVTRRPLAGVKTPYPVIARSQRRIGSVEQTL